MAKRGKPKNKSCKFCKVKYYESPARSPELRGMCACCLSESRAEYLPTQEEISIACQEIQKEREQLRQMGITPEGDEIRHSDLSLYFPKVYKRPGKR